MRLGRSRPARGAYLVVTCLVTLSMLFGTFVFGRTYPDLSLEKAPFGRLATVPAFDPVEDVTLGLPSDAGTSSNVPEASVSIRAIEVYSTQVILLAGGKARRLISIKHPITSLHQLVAAVSDPGWLSESGTHITMNAGVITEAGTSLTIAVPATTEVTMNVRMGVMLAALSARLDFEGVYVHASDPDTPKAGSPTAVRTDLGRPLIFASNASTMNMTNSRFAYLGRDWNSSYGTAWSKGSTGVVQGSTFEHNFIGVYTDHAVNLKVLKSTFTHNSLYGIDPHSYSSGLLIVGNTANDNGRHGIIFSDHVTRSIVRDNVTKRNGLNGLMMDEQSDRNQITHNVSEGNLSDGIVMANSSNNVVTYSTASGNRIGIQVRGVSVGNVFSHNTVTNNRLAAQGVRLSGNSSHDNGGQWEQKRLITVWLIGLALLLGSYAATFVSYRVPGKKRLGSTAKSVVTA